MNYPTAQQIRSEIDEIEQGMSDPAISRDISKMKTLSRLHADKQFLLSLIEQYEKGKTELEEARSLIESDDEEMKKLAEEDVARLEKDIKKMEKEIENLLIPRDPIDDRDVILEIRAGAGGEEASLFAAELYRAYARYAEENGWKLHQLSSAPSEQGGFKEVVAEVSQSSSPEGVFGVLKFERGVHRVQRIPETEKQGRIHTSTVTVAVLPQAGEVDIEIKPGDLRVDTYRASGAGGQHVNKTSSAVRVTHIPTNTVVAVQEERSQHKNREKAMKILRSRLLEQQSEKKRQAEASARKAQVGTGDRSEKIRTYNFPQDRITDHRIKESWSNIPAVLGGQLSPIFNTLKEAEREALLEKAA